MKQPYIPQRITATYRAAFVANLFHFAAKMHRERDTRRKRRYIRRRGIIRTPLRRLEEIADMLTCSNAQFLTEIKKIAAYYPDALPSKIFVERLAKKFSR